MPPIDELITDADGPRRRAGEAIRERQDAIVALALDIQSHPEESFREFATADKLRAYLTGEGFTVAEGSPRLPTSFTATYGGGELTIGICAEYDALPNGHACGHHIILGAALTAAVGLRAVADELGITVKVIGCPAEEHGAGKVYLLQDGCFDDVHAALMVHAIGEGSDARPYGSTSQAVARWRVTFTGRSSHAAGSPEQGINAADAAVVAQVAVGLLRQQIKDGYRASMFIREAGQATNIIPDRAVVDFEVRAPELDAFHELYAKVLRCFEAGALATGCEWSVEQLEPTYEPLLHDEMLSRHWCEAFGAFGRNVEPNDQVFAASTDFGNVGQVLPALHPWVAVDGVDAGLHSDAFRDGSAGPSGMQTLLEGGLAMAWTAIGAVTTPEDADYLRRLRAERRPLERTQIPGQDAVPAAPAPEGNPA